MSNTTPLMKQYFSIKEKYSDAFVFFQVGDFYELFFDDAKKASSLLSITLTKRGYHNGENIPLCGVPSHMVEVHSMKLVKQGYTVVICGQVEKAEVGKLVSRDVTQVLSPGTLTNDFAAGYEDKNLIYFISENEKEIKIFVFEYITFSVEFVSYKKDFLFKEKFLNLISKRKPKEIYLDKEIVEVKIVLDEYLMNYKFLFEKNLENSFLKKWIEKNKIKEDFKETASLFLEYLNKYQNSNLNSDLNSFEYQSKIYLEIDLSTQKHLEIIENNFDGTSKNTLFSVLNKTATTMGTRLLKLWLIHPLQKLNEIKDRQNCVKEFLLNSQLSKLLRKILFEIGDFERLAGRISLKRAFYSDYQRLLSIIPMINEIKEKIFYLNENNILSKIISNLWCDKKVYDFLSERIFINKENGDEDKFIKPESDEKLNEFSKLINSQNEILLNFEREENKRFGVEDYLRIKSTPLYGYVFEISKTKDNFLTLPSEYVCVQTLSQKERYSTPKLKFLENEILGAKEKYKERDKFLFNLFEEEIYKYKKFLMETAKALSELDVLISFSIVAIENNWVLPNINESSNLEIIGGKHPVIESILKSKFIENSLSLSDEKSKGWIITGPNMGGKSTFMRQNALIIILAHVGSYIPAKSANIPILNSIYTRIGASDNVSLGKSTFYLEMEEAAKICSNANEKSLVILDEIGRGTSTYDGISLAAAILEFLSKKIKPFLLFATHYGELYNLISEDKFISWHHVGIIKNFKNEIKISYLIKEGASFDSMGIEMATSVGMNESVIALAKNYKKKLEKNFFKNEFESNKNLTIFDEEKIEDKNLENAKRFLEILNFTNLDELSPREIYNLISDFKGSLE